MRDTGKARDTSPPPEKLTLAALRREAADCSRCPLYRNATQTVFGEGPEDAALMFVGEQPGDREDVAGRPFVGPAGALFDRALAEARIARESVYVTNAVKHFKFQPRGKRRIHQKPNAGEIKACRWWLEREWAAVAPVVVVALGATAAQSLMGRPIPIMKNRGPTEFSWPGFAHQAGFITVHPSSLLRLPEHAQRAEAYDAFVADLRRIRRMLETHAGAA